MSARGGNHLACGLSRYEDEEVKKRPIGVPFVLHRAILDLN